MKYIITESQYNKAMDKFITKQFEGFEEVRIPRYGLVLWVKDGKIIAEILNVGDRGDYFSVHKEIISSISEILNVGDRGDYFFVDRDIFNSIEDMFGLDDYKEVRLNVEHWLEKNHNLSNLTVWRHSQHHSDWEFIQSLL
jgi:hypothetical protein